jgi:hypothetical protein
VPEQSTRHPEVGGSDVGLEEVIGMLADSSFLIRPQFGDGPIQINPCTVTMKRAPLLLMLQSDHWI